MEPRPADTRKLVVTTASSLVSNASFTYEGRGEVT